MRMGIWEILIIVLLIVILFGHNKIPGMMKNLANGLNIFKKELKTEEKPAQKPVAVAEKPVAKKSPAKKKTVAKKATLKKPATKKK